jgi:hypothetical protein
MNNIKNNLYKLNICMGCCISKNEEITSSLLMESEIKHEKYFKELNKEQILCDMLEKDILVGIYNNVTDYVCDVCNVISGEISRWIYEKTNNMNNYERIHKIYIFPDKTVFSYICYDDTEIILKIFYK